MTPVNQSLFSWPEFEMRTTCTTCTMDPVGSHRPIAGIRNLFFLVDPNFFCNVLFFQLLKTSPNQPLKIN